MRASFLIPCSWVLSGRPFVLIENNNRSWWDVHSQRGSTCWASLNVSVLSKACFSLWGLTVTARGALLAFQKHLCCLRVFSPEGVSLWRQHGYTSVHYVSLKSNVQKSHGQSIFQSCLKTLGLMSFSAGALLLLDSRKYWLWISEIPCSNPGSSFFFLFSVIPLQFTKYFYVFPGMITFWLSTLSKSSLWSKFY